MGADGGKKDSSAGVKEISNSLSYSLRIARVPAKTFERFVALAKEEFADDYGMTLKFLLDYYESVEKWIRLRMLELEKGVLNGKEEEGH